MQTPFRLASHLGLPVISDVTGLDWSGGMIHALREINYESSFSVNG